MEDRNFGYFLRASRIEGRDSDEKYNHGATRPLETARVELLRRYSVN